MAAFIFGMPRPTCTRVSSKDTMVCQASFRQPLGAAQTMCCTNTGSLNEQDYVEQTISGANSHLEMLKKCREEVEAMQEQPLSQNEPRGGMTSSANTTEGVEDGEPITHDYIAENKHLRSQLAASESRLGEVENHAQELLNQIKLRESDRAECVKNTESCISFLQRQLADLACSAKFMQQEDEDRIGQLQKQLFVLEAQVNAAEAQTFQMQGAVPKEEYFALKRRLVEIEHVQAETATRQKSAEERTHLLSYENALLQRHQARLIESAGGLELEKDLQHARSLSYFEDRLKKAKSEVKLKMEALDRTSQKLRFVEDELAQQASNVAKKEQEQQLKISGLQAVLDVRHNIRHIQTQRERQLELLPQLLEPVVHVQQHKQIPAQGAAQLQKLLTTNWHFSNIDKDRSDCKLSVKEHAASSSEEPYSNRQIGKLGAISEAPKTEGTSAAHGGTGKEKASNTPLLLATPLVSAPCGRRYRVPATRIRSSVATPPTAPLSDPTFMFRRGK